MSKTSIIVINSLDRINPFDSSTRFTVKIRPAIQGATSVSLAYVLIPNSTYNITAANNLLSFDDGAVRTIAIPPGSYTTTTLGTTIAAAMTAAGSQTYTVTYNPITYHYTISAPVAFSLFYEFFTSASIFPTLGYRRTVNSAPAISHEGNAAVALWRSPNFLIRIDKVPYGVQTTRDSSNWAAFVVNTAQPQNGDVAEWTRNNNYDQTVSVNVNIDTLYIELLDNVGSPAQINDSEWSFAMHVSH